MALNTHFKTLHEAFEDKIIRNDKGCWDWSGSITNGLPKVKFNYKNYQANKYYYELYHGKIDRKGVIVHTCNNKLCLKPEHLKLDNYAHFLVGKTPWNKGKTGGKSWNKGKGLSLLQLFERHLKPVENSCIHWNGFRDKDGYGMLKHNGKENRAHRIAWILKYGEIPNGLWVLHKCDNPSCVNINHLFLGTVQINAADMVNKNRQFKKIGIEQIIEIKKLRSELKPRDIAKRYGVSRSTIYHIIHNHGLYSKYKDLKF